MEEKDKELVLDVKSLEIVIDMQKRLDEYNRFECNLIAILMHFDEELSLIATGTPNGQIIYHLLMDIKKKMSQANK